MKMRRLEKFVFNMFGTNCYVLSDDVSREAVIIDASCYTQDEKEMLATYISDNNLNVKYLLNTHFHLDHLLGAPFVYERYGLTPEASRCERKLIEEAQGQALFFGIRLSERMPEAGTFLEDGDLIEFGGGRLRVIEIPGHSPCGLAYYWEEEACLFSGDSLFCRSIGRTDLPGGSMRALREALVNKVMTLPDDTVVWPGHGPETSVGDEKKFNPFLS